jgi:hypothetical protein
LLTKTNGQRAIWRNHPTDFATGDIDIDLISGEVGVDRVISSQNGIEWQRHAGE